MTKKSALLYGDSLFWGVDSLQAGRHKYEHRIDGVVRGVLGEAYEVICEGLRGRCMYGDNGWFPERDGLEQFGPIFASHLPLDLVVILLGTNDLNTKTNHSPNEIAAALDEYKKKMYFWTEFMHFSMPQVLIVAPPTIVENELTAFMKPIFTGTSTQIAFLDEALKEKAQQLEWYFMSTKDQIFSHRTDGIHLRSDESQKLGHLIADRIQNTV